MYSERTVQKLNEVAHLYKNVILRSLVSVLTQPQYKNTGAGAASVSVEVVEGTTTKAPDILISFDDHLLFIDKRKMQWTRLPDMKDLLAWAETKKSTPNAAKRLAWSVAWDKRKNDTWKAKPWRKKTLSQVLKDLNVRVKAAFDKAIEEDFQQAADDGLAGKAA